MLRLVVDVVAYLSPDNPLVPALPALSPEDDPAAPILSRLPNPS
jgi:hypothetical protein